jgi:hypothetical protein
MRNREGEEDSESGDYVKEQDEKLLKLDIDALSVHSRAFFERAYFKLYMSLMLAGLALMFLGFVSQAGGQSQYYHFTSNNAASNNVQNAYDAAAGGYGFGTFCFFVSFTLAVSAMFIVSPYVCGSQNESLMLKRPFELNSNSSN